MYEDGIAGNSGKCPQGSKPHAIDQFIKAGPCEIWDCSQVEDKLVLYGFMKSGCNTEGLSQVLRVSNQHKKEPLLHTVVVSLDPQTDSGLASEIVGQYSMQQEVWSWWSFDETTALLMNCGFNLIPECSATQQAVLVDQLSRIRGYYILEDAEEVDRLATELAILLNQ
jgi:hypothetical protein